MKETLIKKILEKKLQADDRGNYYGEKYKDHLSFEGGLWQMPEELADLMVFLSDKKIESFLNIGTFNGLTFNLLSDFLYSFGCKKCITIDPHNYNPPIDERFEYLTLTSDNFKDQVFDLVFIDGDHSYNGVKKDYENVGRLAKYCIFHDIDDDFVRYGINNDGGVPRFWEEIKNEKKYMEFIDNSKPIKVMGIGIVYG
jgi:hypothetical protein